MSIIANNMCLLTDLAVQRVVFNSGPRQEKTALASAKADLASLPEYKNIPLTAQKQLLELPFS